MTIGGTSLSSPLVNSLYALAGGSGGVSYPAATLYSHLGQAPSLYDVTEGGNGYCACDAAPGFDGPSGVGAPKGLGAFKSNETTSTFGQTS
jgi:hypothetical protein